MKPFSCVHWRLHTDQYDRYISRGVDASDVLVQRLDGAVAVVVGDGEHQHVTVRPVDRPGRASRHAAITESYFNICLLHYHVNESDLLICSWQYRPSASSWKIHKEKIAEFKGAVCSFGEEIRCFWDLIYQLVMEKINMSDCVSLPHCYLD